MYIYDRIAPMPGHRYTAPMAILCAAVVQFEHAAGDKLANFVKIDRFASEAAERGVRLLAFPECCITGYWFLRNLTRVHLLDLAEEVPHGASTQRLLALSGRLGVTIG